MRRKAHKGVKRFRTKLLALEISFCVYQRINIKMKNTRLLALSRALHRDFFTTLGGGAERKCGLRKVNTIKIFPSLSA